MTFMTEKDKKLLYILAIVVILFVFLNYLIFPQVRQSSQLDRELEETQFRKMQMQQNILSMSGQDRELRQQEERLQQTARKYYPEMTSQEIDSEMTGLILDNHLKAVELKIEMPVEPADLPVYQKVNADTAVSDDTADTKELLAEEKTEKAENTQNKEKQTNKETEQNTEIYAANIKAVAEGRAEDCQVLLDELAMNYPSVRVVGCSFQRVQLTGMEQESKNPEAVMQRMKLELELYMYCERTGM